MEAFEVNILSVWFHIISSKFTAPNFHSTFTCPQILYMIIISKLMQKLQSFYPTFHIIMPNDVYLISVDEMLLVNNIWTNIQKKKKSLVVEGWGIFLDKNMLTSALSYSFSFTFIFFYCLPECASSPFILPI